MRDPLPKKDKMSSGGKIYLDYNATTPLAPEVLEATCAALRDLWANPSSAHDAGKLGSRVSLDKYTYLSLSQELVPNAVSLKLEGQLPG